MGSGHDEQKLHTAPGALADRARDAPGELVWDMVVQAMKSPRLSCAAIKQLALVAIKFPGALDQRHWPPLSLDDDFPEPPLAPGQRISSVIHRPSW